MLRAVLVAVLAAAAACVHAQTPTQFRATLRVANDPRVTGFMNGVLYYHFAQQKMEIAYTTSSVNGFREIYNYNDADPDAANANGNVRYMACLTKCDAETFKGDQVRIHRIGETALGAPVPASVQDALGRTCSTAYTLSGTTGGVQRIYVDGSGLPCEVWFADGKRWYLSGVQASTHTFPIPSQCPAKTCASQMDVVFVIDQSGSIDGTEFSQLRTFVHNVASGFDISAQGTAVGLRRFGCSNNPTFLSVLSTDRNGVLSVINGMQSGFFGCTCITCGIEGAMDEFRLRGRRFAGRAVQRVQLVITDGVANDRAGELSTMATNARSSSNEANGGNAILFAIGIGDGISDANLDTIKSNLPGVQTKLTATSFATLNQIVESLKIATCIDLAGTSCGSGCRGFCGCDGQCLCPDCNDANECTIDECTAGAFSTACRWNTRSCSDSDPCTQDLCNPASGCSNPAQPPGFCTPTSSCFTVSCVQNTGCVQAGRNCKDSDPCTDEQCVPFTNGSYVCTTTINNPNCASRCAGVTCPPQPCGTNECDPSVFPAVCRFTPRNCDDGNPCTVDSCSTEQNACVHTRVVDAQFCNDNNACTDDVCVDNVGCQNPAWNVTVRCDDGKKCTIDTCEPTSTAAPTVDNPRPQCVHTAVACTAPDVCTSAVCDESRGGDDGLGGCFYPFVDCTTVPELAVLLRGGCYIAYCRLPSGSGDTGGCALDLQPNRTADACGKCDGDGTTCVFDAETAATAALGALAIAAIVIAVIAAVAAIAVFAGQKGYELIFKGQQSLSGAQSNPLHDHGNMKGENPLYDAPK